MPKTTQRPNNNRTTERDRGGSPRSGGTPTPPLLIGGVIQAHGSKKAVCPFGGGIDYLTVTVPTKATESLLSHSWHDEPGKAIHGYKSSERREIHGGTVWRRWDPYTASNAHGFAYETWEAESDAAPVLDRYTTPLPGVSATRQDFAFDFSVDRDFVPADLLPVIRSHIEARGMEPHFKGPESSHTIYLGSRHSDRFLKIYRRDLKDRSLLDEYGTPILRIEIELRNDSCLNLWHQRQATGEEGLSIAATHIAEMIGYSPYDRTDPLPPPMQARPEAEPAQTFMRFMDQGASTIVAAEEAGICTKDQAYKRVGKLSRMSQHRLNKRIELFKSVPREDLIRAIDYLMNHGNPQPDPT